MNHFHLYEQNDVAYLLCRPLEQAGFPHAFSTRRGGVSPLPERALNLGHFQGDAPENVAENRRRFLDAIGTAPMKLITAKQVHSADVITVRAGDDTPAPLIGDALISDVPGLWLGVQTADCVPILMADTKRRAVAAVHAGWRGTRARIVEKTMARLQHEFAVQPEDCLAALGPAAGVCCYEVGEEVTGQFRSEFRFAESIIANHKPDGKAHLDLLACNARLLAETGVPESNIFTSPFCTLCRNDLFFSHRLEKDSGVGRLMSVIGIQ